MGLLSSEHCLTELSSLRNYSIQCSLLWFIMKMIFSTYSGSFFFLLFIIIICFQKDNCLVNQWLSSVLSWKTNILFAPRLTSSRWTHYWQQTNKNKKEKDSENLWKKKKKNFALPLPEQSYFHNCYYIAGCWSNHANGDDSFWWTC